MKKSNRKAVHQIESGFLHLCTFCFSWCPVLLYAGLYRAEKTPSIKGRRSERTTYLLGGNDFHAASKAC
ncbi:hypothetical protein MUP95_07875 [bacterium]|nr:hypothetical protein [bacterium]